MTLGVPLGLPKELGISGRVFTDFGTLVAQRPEEHRPDARRSWPSTGGVQPQIVDSRRAIRASAGVGVSWKSPVGPIRLDLAMPLKKESFDKTQFFHVSFGTRF